MLTIILIAFCSQILLISYIYPKQVVKRIDYVLNNYPIESYPKLYPVSQEKVLTIKSTYLMLNYFFALVGIALLVNFGFIETDYDKNLRFLDDIPLLYGMAQYIPYLFLEVFCFKQLRKMKALHQSNTRTAQLRPRRITDFIPSHYLLLAAATYVIFVVFELFVYDFAATSDMVIKLATVTVVNGLFIIIGLANVYGAKSNPLQNHSERSKQTRFTLHSLLFISIFMTLYLMAHSWVNVYEFNYAEILINILYFQVIAVFSMGALLGRFNVEEMNFDAYKKTA